MCLAKNQTNGELPEEKSKRLEQENAALVAVNDELKKEIEELHDLNKKYLNTIEWMQKKIQQLEDDLDHTKAKLAEFNSSNGSPLLVKK